jgi:hypothetical protein
MTQFRKEYTVNPLHHRLLAGLSRAVLFCLALQAVLLSERACAINITVDYRYDTNNFFNTQQKKDALQAAANRYSAVITESLLGASLQNNNLDPRIGFNHPGTGASFQVSAATSTANDAVVAAGGGAANEYRGNWSIAANEWILYAGGRPLSVAGEGGTGTGTNLVLSGGNNDVFDMSTSHLNRNFRSSGSVQHLPVWGGAITFDNDGSTTWHFNPDTTPPSGSLDLYSIALHEIGHALGLSAQSTDWDQFRALPPNEIRFLGPQTLSAYNADNGTSVSFLNQESVSNRHWDDGAYESRIFMNASPKLVATVGEGLQDLLMEPTANSTATVKRFELTNVDVAALRDLGWSTVPQINLQPGDYNKNGIVDAADYVMFSKGLADGTYATWRANFAETLAGASAIVSPNGGIVPEPASWLFLAFSIAPTIASRRLIRR